MKKTYADRLDEYLGTERQDFYRDINRRFGYSKSTIRNSLMKTKDDCDTAPKVKRNVIERAVFLYTVYSIPLHIFDLSKQNIFTKKSIQPSSLKAFLDIEELDKNVRELQSKYPKVLQEYVSQAESSLWVYDYFLPALSSENSYRVAHKGYYKAIEKQLQTKGTLEYHRSLVFDYDPHRQPEGDKMTIIRRLIRKCSIIGFTHLVNCFSLYSERFTLSFSYFPYRLYSYAIIDNKYLITEYLRYSKQLNPRPDMVFVNEVNGHESMRKLKEKFLRPIQRQELDHFVIGKSAFKHTVYKALDDISAEIQKYENEIDDIDPFNEKGNDYDRVTQNLENRVNVLYKEREMLQQKRDILATCGF